MLTASMKHDSCGINLGQCKLYNKTVKMPWNAINITLIEINLGSHSDKYYY